MGKEKKVSKDSIDASNLDIFQPVKNEMKSNGERMMRPGELPTHANIGKGEITRHYDVIYVQLFLITPRYSPIVRLIKRREFYFSSPPSFSSFYIHPPDIYRRLLLFLMRNIYKYFP